MKRKLQRRPSVLLLAFAMIGLLSVACRSTQPASTQVDDAAITAKVKTKLTADPEINPFNVDVDTEEGVVYLRGRVEDAGTRAEAVKLARNTQGVVRVVNEITLGDKSIGERLTDSEIVSRVKTKLTADPEVNPFNIDVDANDGVVTLSGRVRTSDQKREAGDLARGTKGVRSVKNQLRVGETD